jgi:hypothetical protein
MANRPDLTALEHELLELASMAGETTTTLDEEMLDASPGRQAVEAALDGLARRGLVTRSKGVYAGQPRRADGARVYEDDWWDVTAAGRRAIGLQPRGTTGT